jgi:hypothetical protein
VYTFTLIEPTPPSTRWIVTNQDGIAVLNTSDEQLARLVANSPQLLAIVKALHAVCTRRAGALLEHTLLEKAAQTIGAVTGTPPKPVVPDDLHHLITNVESQVINEIIESLVATIIVRREQRNRTATLLAELASQQDATGWHACRPGLRDEIRELLEEVSC